MKQKNKTSFLGNQSSENDNEDCLIDDGEHPSCFMKNLQKAGCELNPKRSPMTYIGKRLVEISDFASVMIYSQIICLGVFPTTLRVTRSR